MRLFSTAQRFAVALATIGIALPSSSVIAAEQARPHRSDVRMADIALADGGDLRGQVADAQGVGLAGRQVSVQRQGRQFAKLTTDSEGRFTARGLSGGTYLVATDGAIGAVRAWAPATAPPSAAPGVLLVPETQTVRGQLPIVQGPARFLLNPGVMITGAVIGTVIAVAVDQNSGS